VIKESFDGHNARGEWRPLDTALPPLFRWPLKPLEISKWFVGFPGYLFPWNALIKVISLITWWFLAPDLVRAKTFELGWVASIYFRNLVLLILLAGTLHLRFFVRKSQGVRY
jgi:hypothetical protein